MKLKQIAKRNPNSFRYLARFGEHKDYDRRVVRKGDDVVIEGFPRSANTFATRAFVMAQERDVMVGNHFHHVNQVLLAARFSIPALVLIRRPEDAIRSLVIYHGGSVSPEDAARRYLDFYEPLLSRPGCYTPAPFEEVTTAFGASVERLNRWFGTDFVLFDHSPAAEEAVFGDIEERRKRRAAKGIEVSDLKITVPSDSKSKAVETVDVQAAENWDLNSILRNVNEVYDEVMRHPSLAD